MKKAKTSNQQPLYVYDIHVGAFLELNGIVAELKKEGTRVVFCFPDSVTTHNAIELYYANPEIQIVDFVSHLRRLRAQMLSMRG